MTRKKFSDVEKVKHVIGSLSGEAVTKYCAEHHIARSSLYAWRKSVLVALSTLLKQKNRRSHSKPRHKSPWCRKYRR
jgi:transposase-like protein